MNELLAHVAPTLVSIKCAEEIHALEWHAGELHALSHPDPDAEIALTGLGGPPRRCVDLLRSWQAFQADPRVLTIGPRDSDPVLRETAGSFQQIRASYRRNMPPEAELFDLLTFDSNIARCLVATVAATLITRANPTYEHLLNAALYGRVRTGLGAWLRRLPRLELDVIDPAAQPRLRPNADGSYDAALPLTWLTDVWAPELVTVSGRFVVSADRSERGYTNLVTVNPAGEVSTLALLDVAEE
jgi:hypothetical protein